MLGHESGFKKGLSRVRGNLHARFLGELWLVTVMAYPIIYPILKFFFQNDDILQIRLVSSTELKHLTGLSCNKP